VQIRPSPRGPSPSTSSPASGFPRALHRDLRSRIVGKTTLALHAIAEAQKAGGYAAFIDAEHALDPLYAQKLG